MNVTDALKQRRTVRAFKPNPVDKETILKILEAASRAPSAMNSQPWQVYVAGGEVLEKLRQAYLARFDQGAPPALELQTIEKQWPAPLQARIESFQANRLGFLGIEPNDEVARKAMMRRNPSFFGAPVVVYLCMDRTLASFSMLSLGMLAQSIMLAAQDYGVDSAPAAMLVAYPDLLRAELGISQELSIVFGIALGYADPEDMHSQYRSPRRPIEEVVTFEGF